MDEKDELKKEIEQKKNDLKVYLEIYPLLGVSEEEKDRVTNQLLDDILNRQKRLKELE